MNDGRLLTEVDNWPKAVPCENCGGEMCLMERINPDGTYWTYWECEECGRVEQQS